MTGLEIVLLILLGVVIGMAIQTAILDEKEDSAYWRGFDDGVKK